MSEMLNVALERGGRVPVTPAPEVIGHKNIYVVGDMAYLKGPNGRPYPQLIPVAKQQGKLATTNRRINNRPQSNFHYYDRDIMATIGRSRAVALIYNRIPFTGFIA